MTTCVWIAGVGGIAGGSWEVWRQLPGVISPGGAGAALGAPGVDIGGLGPVIANVPEPSTLAVMVVAVVAIAALNEWRRAKRRAARVSRFTGWPPPPPKLMSAEDDGVGSAVAVLVGAAIGVVFWALLLVPAWIWGLL